MRFTVLRKLNQHQLANLADQGCKGSPIIPCLDASPCTPCKALLLFVQRAGRAA